MKPEEIYQLAQQGNPHAIAEILNQKLRSQGILVMTEQAEEQHLQIIFEGSATPDKAEIQQHLQPLQSHWQQHLTLTITAFGFRFGAEKPDWEWAIAKGLRSSEARQQSQAKIAPIQQLTDAQQHRRDLAIQLQKILAPYLWHSQITQMHQALVIKLNVVKKIDRRQCRQVIYDALKSLEAEDVQKVYLNVYHRPTEKYLWKEVWSPNAPLEIQPSDQALPAQSHRLPSKETVQAIAIGLGLGILIFCIPLSRFILDYFLTFVHELGHAAAFWVFGYPAVPSFDFIFGGGVTLALNQVGILMILVYLLLGYVAFFYRRNTRTLILLGALTLLHILCLITPWHEAVIVMMGHVAEIAAVFICGYFALGRYFCYVNGEQTMYAMLASFCFLENCSFFSKLIFSETFRIAYRVGKGGLLDNDLVQLANDFFPFGLGGTAISFLLCTLAMPIIAWGAFHYEPRWIQGFYRLCQPNPEID